jgi:HD-like signal output (HDOD) protein
VKGQAPEVAENQRGTSSLDPNVLINLEGRINNPETDIQKILDLIKTEPVLSGRLIKLFNSVLFLGGCDKVLDLSSEIMSLGLKMFLYLTVSFNASKFLKPQKLSII